MLLLRKYKEDITEGKLVYPDDSYTYCVELPYKDNIPDHSCIPEGQYIVERDHTGKHQFYRFKHVEGRTNIEIHKGNFTKDSLGCLLPNMYLKDGRGFNSEQACNKLLAWFGESSFVLEIREYKENDGEW